MEISGHIFTGVMDQDSDPRIVSPQDYVSAYDILNGYGATPGSVIAPRSNLLYDLGLPEAGDNICIGTWEDKQTASLYIFIYNSADDHRVYRYLANEGTHYTVAAGAVLAFQPDWLITQAAVMDGELLYWLDGEVREGPINGNPQRKINAIKANPNKEYFEYELYAGLPGEVQFANGAEYEFSITDLDGTNQTEINTYTADGTYENDPAGGLSWLKTHLENDYTYPGSEFIDCDGCKIIIRLPQASPKRLALTTNSNDVLLVEVNIYPVTLDEHHIDLLKQPPHCAPSAEYFNDPDRQVNNVGRLCSQFRVRYIYDDKEPSAWGPVSNIALNTGVDGEPIELLNGIKVDFTDDRLSSISWLNIIRFVEIAFRDGNENDWRLIERIPVCEIGIATQVYSFYNDKLYSTVPSDDTSTSSELQVLKPFDFLPIKSAALTAGSDNDGNSLLFLADNLENYTNPDCVTLIAQPEEFADECLIDIIGTVEIINDANFSTADPDYSNYPLDGFVVYLAGTPYYGISLNPADGSGTGAFRISGVPKAKYIIRVASYKCSFTNDLGPRYNMANGLEWQRTSAPVIDCAGAVANGRCQYEREVDLSAFGTNVFDLDTETDYGTIQVQNGHWTNRLIWDPEDESPQDNHAEAYVFNEIYLLDSNATIPNGVDDVTEDYDAMKSALGVERQKITLNPLTPGPDLTTDHNGYCFYGEYSPADDTTWYLTSVAVNDNNITVPGDGPTYPGDWVHVYDETITNRWTTGSLLAGLMLYDPAGTPGDPPLYYTQTLLIFNDGNLDIEGPYSIELNAVISDGITGLDGVLFTMARTGRSATTGPDGLARISFYADYDNSPERIGDQFVAFYPPDTCHLGYPDPFFEDIDFESTIPDPPEFTGSTYQFDLALMDINSGRFFKGGAEYTFAVLYEDRGNRTPGAVGAAKVVIPAHVNGLTKWQVLWAISSIPPEWATHFRIVRLKNATHSVYVQWTLKTVEYVRIPSQLEDPIITTFAAGDYTHLLFQLYTPITTITGDQPDTNLFFQQDGQQGYVPQQGDRVRLLLNDLGNPVNTAGRTYEAEIVGIRVDGDNVYAIVPAVFGTLEVKKRFLAEYFTPVTALPEIYYEGGEDCYEIIDPGTEDRRHEGNINNQTVGGSPSPAIGMITGGDTYWRRQRYTESGIYETEHQTPTRYQTTPCQDIGRPFVLSGTIQQEHYYNRIRVSGAYIPVSAINGFSSYAALEYKDFNRQWGPISWIGFANNVLLSLCHFRVQPVYVGKGELLYLSGPSNVGRSDQVMSIADESVTDYGCRNPESVVNEDGNVSFWDVYNGAWCRYAQNGVVPITSKMVSFFHARGQEHLSMPYDNVPAGYDRRFRLMTATLGGEEAEDVYTLSFDDAKGGWPTFHSFNAEAYGRVGQMFMSFNDGEMYIHYEGDGYTNFYDEQFSPKITIAVNNAPALRKLFKHLRIMSNRKWYSPIITIPYNFNAQVGMESELPAGHVNPYEGQWHANFLRDKFDPHLDFAAISPDSLKWATSMLRGRPLRGEVMLLTIQAADGSVDTNLTRVDVYYLPSKISNA